MNTRLIALILIVTIVGGCISSKEGGVLKSTQGSFITEWRDLGEIQVYGDGLPGYDVDRNGKADYVESGLFPYAEFNRTGGFEYSGGKIHIKETGANITLPAMYFVVLEFVESSVGSVAIFEYADDASNMKAVVLVKTLGRNVNTYTFTIESKDPSYSYRITDILDEKGSGTFEKGEVEGTGIIRL